jgi:hypothetical protein
MATSVICDQLQDTCPDSPGLDRKSTLKDRNHTAVFNTLFATEYKFSNKFLYICSYIQLYGLLELSE